MTNALLPDDVAAQMPASVNNEIEEMFASLATSEP